MRNLPLQNLQNFLHCSRNQTCLLRYSLRRRFFRRYLHHSLRRHYCSYYHYRCYYHYRRYYRRCLTRMWYWHP